MEKEEEGSGERWKEKKSCLECTSSILARSLATSTLYVVHQDLHLYEGLDTTQNSKLTFSSTAEENKIC